MNLMGPSEPIECEPLPEPRKFGAIRMHKNTNDVCVDGDSVMVASIFEDVTRSRMVSLTFHPTHAKTMVSLLPFVMLSFLSNSFCPSTVIDDTYVCIPRDFPSTTFCANAKPNPSASLKQSMRGKVKCSLLNRISPGYVFFWRCILCVEAEKKRLEDARIRMSVLLQDLRYDNVFVS